MMTKPKRFPCTRCDAVLKSNAGRSSHVRARHPEPEGSRLARSLEQTIGELGRLGRIEEIDAAQVELLRGLLAAIETDPLNAAMWRQYREALGEVLKADEPNDDRLDQALEALGAAGGNSALRHPETS